MKFHVEITSLCVLMCAVCALAGPLKGLQRSAKSKSTKQILDQENELEKLAAQSLDNVAVQSQKSFHSTNINGKVKTESAKEEKVLDPVKEKVVLDIKQHSKSDNSKESGPGKTETDIDFPEAGIHKSIITNNDQLSDTQGEAEFRDQSEALQYTPSVVASYLMSTGEFKEFDQALKELVNSSAMTEAEAEKYRDNVRREYNRLVLETEAEAQAAVANAQSYYPFSLGTIESLPEASYDVPLSMDDVFQLYGQNNRIPNLDIRELSNADVMRESIEGRATLSDLIKELMDEWLSRALARGDSEAGAMLKNIMTVVSKDNDPDNLKQVRQILTDLFANEVLNSLEPRDETDKLLDYPAYEELNGFNAATQTNNDDEDQIESDDHVAQEQPTVEEEGNSNEESDSDESELDELVKAAVDKTPKSSKTNTHPEVPAEEKAKLKM